jgi:subfamily B ATP-binding cassette protein MsbA
MRSYLRLLQFVLPYKRTLAFAFLCSLLYALFNAAAIWLSASFITTIFTPEGSSLVQHISTDSRDLNEALKNFAWQLLGGGSRFDVVQRVGIVFFFTFLLRNIFDVGQVYFLSYIEQKVIKDLRDRIYTHYLAQSIRFYQTRKVGELASVVLNDVAALNNHIMKAITFLMRDPFVIAIFLVLLLAISLKLTLAALILLPVAGILIERLGQSLKRKSLRVQNALAQVTHLLQERLGGVRLIKIFGTEAAESRRFAETTQKHFRMALRQRRLDFVNVPLTELLGLGIITLILIYGGYLVFEKSSIDAEDFVRFIAILFSILTPAKSLVSAYNSLQISSALADRIFGALDTDERLPMFETAEPLDSFENGVRFEAVSFRYPNMNQNALTDITLEIPKGMTLAIVGPSGAGKSTLIGLAVRLFDPTAGRITIDGHDIRHIAPDSLHRLFGIVSQDIVLFNDTVAANIGYGRDGISQDQIVRAARLAYADGFIAALPSGYETQVGDRGLTLSGGQQQRLSIARALVDDPPIIIFDEATSQLDSESEALIQQALETLSKDHTLIIIAHRLATIRKVDRIVVLENGRLVDQGTYEELQERCELFIRLCQQQFLL